jgi:hypothetical protein
MCTYEARELERDEDWIDPLLGDDMGQHGKLDGDRAYIDFGRPDGRKSRLYHVRYGSNVEYGYII